MKLKVDRPYAMTMWDFSWLERRWSGAGYECWDRALDELAERGYDLIRLDAYPHFVAANKDELYTVVPDSTWTQFDWGSPGRLGVRVMPALTEFIHKAYSRGIRIGLSTWFRQDLHDIRLQIGSPGAMADIWFKTLQRIRSEVDADALVYLDFCNEFPGDKWAPFFKNEGDSCWNGTTLKARNWMQETVRVFRQSCDNIPLTFSFAFFQGQSQLDQDWSFLDLLEPHIWMCQAAPEFYNNLGYCHQAYDTSGLELIANHMEPLYRSDPQHWQMALKRRIHAWAEVSRKNQLGIMTSECWSIVDAKDWPGIDWGWIKELCAFGVEEALSCGRWIGMATSNFCGPQFVGMWRDIEWHQRLTQRIRNAVIDSELHHPAPDSSPFDLRFPGM